MNSNNAEYKPKDKDNEKEYNKSIKEFTQSQSQSKSEYSPQDDKEEFNNFKSKPKIPMSYYFPETNTNLRGENAEINDRLQIENRMGMVNMVICKT